MQVAFGTAREASRVARGEAGSHRPVHDMSASCAPGAPRVVVLGLLVAAALHAPLLGEGPEAQRGRPFT